MVGRNEHYNLPVFGSGFQRLWRESWLFNAVFLISLGLGGWVHIVPVSREQGQDPLAFKFSFLYKCRNLSYRGSQADSSNELN